MYDYECSLPPYKDVDAAKNCKKVYETLLSLGTANDRQIAERLGWSINRVTPRRNELFASGKILRFCRKKDNLTNRLTNFWQVI